MDKTLLALGLVLIGSTLKAQLLQEKSFYPGTSVVTRKSFNGSGGKGFWTLDSLDAQGRVIVKNYYRNKKYLQQDRYYYNDKSDIIASVEVFDINTKNKNDTTKFEYIYKKDLMVYQKKTQSNQDSTVIKLVENNGDSILHYLSQAYTYVPDKKIWVESLKSYVIKVRNKRIIQWMSEAVDNELGKVVTDYKYDEGGKMVWRRVDGNTPEAFTLGSPEGPVREYEYEFDRLGRRRKMYTIVNGEKILLAAYDYQ